MGVGYHRLMFISPLVSIISVRRATVVKEKVLHMMSPGFASSAFPLDSRSRRVLRRI
jgi:hypothetical protein